ncbi:EF-P 5-aminopentanol modification-associated protein YfmF [Agrilactobacillus fermenti]|uniref:EF-P 5-aminopentanol modification-associated protein YfmF n=1 Tax=Agrilactobacillus fermenti TaxID=2586909 RepID=UPI003A5BE95D
MIELKPGIYLQIDPTNKFKTINFTINFLEKATKKNISKRALLAQILENSNAKYQTPDQIATELEQLYGADYSFSQYLQGNISVLSVSGICADPKFLPTTADIFTDLLADVRLALFQPALETSADAFDTTIFQREQQNLSHRLGAYLDDKQYAAMLATRQLYFGEDAPLSSSSLGTLADLQQITADNLYTYYRQMLAANEIVITVTGDVTEAQLRKLFDWPELVARNREKIALYYAQPLFQKVKSMQQQADVVQSKLNMMFQAPVHYYHEGYFAFLLANTIFGGSAQSLLFMNVREKQSLAYYASSSFDAFTGTILVQTGIDLKQKQKVIDSITAQLSALSTGQVAQTLVDNAKTLLIDQFAMRSDAPFGRNLRYLFQFLEPRVIMDSETLKTKIQQVDLAQIQAAAAQFKLQAVFALEGRRSDENN